MYPADKSWAPLVSCVLSNFCSCTVFILLLTYVSICLMDILHAVDMFKITESTLSNQKYSNVTQFF